MNFEAPFVSIYFGVFLLAFYGWMWRMPAQSTAALKAFPRSVWPGRILIAVSVAWFASNLNQVDLGRFNNLKMALWVAVPLGIFLITQYLPDLLSVRGFCTFCLLAGQSVLVAVRWHGTISQTAVALLVYVLMVECMFLVLYPHFWIRGIQWMEAVPQRRVMALSAGFLISAGLLICGFISL
ncbi:hypothetical protein P0Y35_01955 [Kiritimatiellaeota bacterium B1221]|nr:hypothetical protein [Kiritimatiellaeota bacterium B1221]